MDTTIIGISFKAGDKEYEFSVESIFPSENEWNNRYEIDNFDEKMNQILATYIHNYKTEHQIKDETVPNSMHFAPHFIVK